VCVAAFPPAEGKSETETPKYPPITRGARDVTRQKKALRITTVF
jgi:hypothetical protein